MHEDRVKVTIILITLIVVVHYFVGLVVNAPNFLKPSLGRDTK